jgi:hypothetical protein
MCDERPKLGENLIELEYDDVVFWTIRVQGSPSAFVLEDIGCAARIG